MAEWLLRWTCNPEATSSTPALSASGWILSSVVPSPNPRSRLQNSQLDRLLAVGILKYVIFHLSLFVSLSLSSPIRSGSFCIYHNCVSLIVNI